MAFKVFTNAPPNSDVYFRLVDEGDGEVVLEACKENGEHICNVLRIMSNGKLYRFHGVEDDLGFQLDGDYRIVSHP